MYTSRHVLSCIHVYIPRPASVYRHRDRRRYCNGHDNIWKKPLVVCTKAFFSPMSVSHLTITAHRVDRRTV